MTALIIAGGILENEAVIKEKTAHNRYDLIIACDSGYDNAMKLGICPQYVVGDLDSVQKDIKNCEIIKLQPEKDDTDLRVALNFALSKKVCNITILCATGGRLDHFYANASNLEYLDNLNITAQIIDENNVISIIKNSKKSYKNISKYVSIIPIDEKIVLTTANLKYKADKLEILRENIISVSNESLSDEFFIEVLGKAYVIQSSDKR